MRTKRRRRRSRRQRIRTRKLLISGTAVLVIAGQVQFNLPLLKLAFLYTKYICLRFPEKIQEALTHTGPEAVYIP